MNKDEKGRFRPLPEGVKILDTDMTILEYKNNTFSIPSKLLSEIPNSALIYYFEMRLAEKLNNQIINN